MIFVPTVYLFSSTYTKKVVGMMSDPIFTVIHDMYWLSQNVHTATHVFCCTYC